jgi:hypothetical protein
VKYDNLTGFKNIGHWDELSGSMKAGTFNVCMVVLAHASNTNTSNDSDQQTKYLGLITDNKLMFGLQSGSEEGSKR